MRSAPCAVAKSMDTTDINSIESPGNLFDAHLQTETAVQPSPLLEFSRQWFEPALPVFIPFVTLKLSGPVVMTLDLR